MPDNNPPVIPNPVFSVAAAASGFDANADYPFFNEIISDDNSIAVSGQTPADLSVSIVADSSVGGVLEFFVDRADEEKAGLHLLRLATSTKGIVYLSNGALQILPFPEGRAVLCCNESNELVWVHAPGSDEYAFGTGGSNWAWYRIDECEDACSEETTP